MRATCPAHLILLALITPIILGGEENKPKNTLIGMCSLQLRVWFWKLVAAEVLSSWTYHQQGHLSPY
jgi:hypothetical protein